MPEIEDEDEFNGFLFGAITGVGLVLLALWAIAEPLR